MTTVSLNCKFLFLFLGFAVGILLATAQGLVINEVVYSNDDLLEDPNGDYSDWVEIYNTTGVAINMEGYYLSDDEDDLLKWAFPSVSIAPNGFLLVHANGADIAASLEANFELSVAGEALLLTSSGGTVVDQLESKPRAVNRSYGRIPDGGAAFGALLIPSPASSNEDNGLIQFSHDAGYYTEAISLTLSSASSGHEIRFTSDGSIPTASSPLFGDGLVLDSRLGDPNVLSENITTMSAGNYVPSAEMFKIHTMRMATFLDGEQSSPVLTKSYLVDEDMFERYPMPIVSIVSDAAHFFDFNEGIYTAGVHFDTGNSIWSGNYFMRGEEWERPIHLEYFDIDGSLVMAQDAGVRIHGGRTRGSRQKSLKLYARSEYGKSRFYEPVLPNDEEGSHKRLLLRTATACWNKTVIKDGVSQRICRNLDMETMDVDPVVVFLNGEFWGIHELRNLQDKHYLSAISGEDADSINILQVGSGIRPGYPLDWGIQDGSNTAYIALMEYVQQNDLALDEHYQFVSQQVDVSSMIDYYCAEIFLSNNDWISRNHKMWKGSEPDSKWRWLFFDLDAGWGYTGNNWNLFQSSLSPVDTGNNNPPYATRLFRKMMDNQTFQDAFLQRMACLLKNEFSEEVMLADLELYKSMVEPVIDEQSSRWDRPTSMSSWNSAIASKLSSFAQERQDNVVSHISQTLVIDFDPENYSCTESTTEHFDTDSEFVLYPNPAGDFASISSRRGAAIRFIEVYDAQMNRVMMVRKQSMLDLTSLSAGMYFVRIVSDDSSVRDQTLRLVKS